MLAAARSLSTQDRSHGPRFARKSALVGGLRQWQSERRPTRCPHTERDASEGTDVDVVALVRAVWAPLPKWGNGGHHKSRVTFLEVLVAEARRREIAGCEVLDEHVGFGEQSREDLRPLPMIQAQRDAPLVEIQVAVEA